MNEPAFPQKEPLTSDCHGMTLRDYFAAKAMQAMIASWDNEKPWPCNIDPSKDEDDTRTGQLARAAYWFADAMVKERDAQRHSSGATGMTRSGIEGVPLERRVRRLVDRRKDRTWKHW